MERSLLLQAFYGPLLDSRAQNCVWNPSSGLENKYVIVCFKCSFWEGELNP